MGTPRLAPRYHDKGAPIGRGQCPDNQSYGMLELANRRAVNAEGDEKYLDALRRYQLRLADKIEAEMLGCPREVRASITAAEGSKGSKFERDLQRIRDGADITDSPPISGVAPW